MGDQQVVIRGRIQPDGTLQVDEKINFPPGPVAVTVRTASAATRKGTLQVLEEIWAQREQRHMVGRSQEEVDAEISAMRDEDERRAQEIESIQQGPLKGQG